MLKIQRAFLGELLFVFFGVLGVVTAVVFGAITLRFVYRGAGLGMGLLLELIPSLLPLAITYSLPFSWLAAVSLVLGRMSADKEITALRSAGLHLRILVVPLLSVGCLIACFSVLFNAYTVPAAQREMQAGVRRYVEVFLSSLKDVDRRVTLENGRFSFGRFEDGAFWDVELDRRSRKGALQFKVLARRLEIRKPLGDEAGALEFTFEDAYVLGRAESGEPTIDYRGGDNTRLQMGRVEKVGTSVIFNEFFGTQRFTERPRRMTMPDLLYSHARGGVWRGRMKRVQVSLHGRLAEGLAPFALGLFATGMGLLVPAAGRRVRHFLLAFLPPVLLQVPLFVAAPSLGREGVLPAWLVPWLAVLAVGAVGAVLVVIAYRR